MATGIVGRNFEVTPDIRDLIDKKLGRIINKLFDDVIEYRCVLQVEKYRYICEILIVGKEHDVKAVQESDESMQDAINAAVDDAAYRLLSEKPDLALLDCMSYTRSELARASAILPCLVVLPAAVAVQAASALLSHLHAP